MLFAPILGRVGDALSVGRVPPAPVSVVLKGVPNPQQVTGLAVGAPVLRRHLVQEVVAWAQMSAHPRSLYAFGEFRLWLDDASGLRFGSGEKRLHHRGAEQDGSGLDCAARRSSIGFSHGRLLSGLLW